MILGIRPLGLKLTTIGFVSGYNSLRDTFRSVLPTAMYQAPIHAPIGRAASPNPGSRSPALGLVNRSPLMQEKSLYGYSNPVMSRPLSRGPSPAPPAPYGVTSPQASGFQVEKRARSPNPYGRPGMPQPDPAAYREEALYQDHVSALIAAKNDQFAVSGRIPVDPAQFVLFFRSKVTLIIFQNPTQVIKEYFL